MKALIVLSIIYTLSVSVCGQVQSCLAIEAVPHPLTKGANFIAQLTLRIAPGWHISSLTQPSAGGARTVITLSDNQPFKFAGPVTGPKPNIKYDTTSGVNVEIYTGIVEFKLPLVTLANIDPSTKLIVEITYQACNAETCLLPMSIIVSRVIQPRSSNTAN